MGQRTQREELKNAVAKSFSGDDKDLKKKRLREKGVLRKGENLFDFAAIGGIITRRGREGGKVGVKPGYGYQVLR